MLTDVLNEALHAHNISPEEFSELVIRLLDHGVISRNKSQVETRLYDRYVECEALVEDYLQVLRVRIQHERKFCFVRVFPPGATVPGMIDSDDSAFNGGFRIKPSQQDVAAILVLRVEYEKSIREGQVDEHGCVLISIESLAIAHNNLLKRPLPELQGERAAMFKRLRQLRLIDFNLDEDVAHQDSWLSIQPSISSFVSDEVLASLYPDSPEPADSSEPTNSLERIESQSDKPEADDVL